MESRQNQSKIETESILFLLGRSVQISYGLWCGVNNLNVIFTGVLIIKDIYISIIIISTQTASRRRVLTSGATITDSSHPDLTTGPTV